MNVREYLPAYADVPAPSTSVLEKILITRQTTCLGFWEVEKSNGAHESGLILTTKPGQETARLFLMRGLEEIAESFDSHDELHRQEELIDAFNFFFNITAFDEFHPDARQALALGMSMASEVPHKSQPIDFNVLMAHLHPFLEKLRNRVWQQSVQSTYWDGLGVTQVMLLHIYRSILASIGGWNVFYPLFYAKDDVLQFRLRSNY